LKRSDKNPHSSLQVAKLVTRGYFVQKPYQAAKPLVVVLLGAEKWDGSAPRQIGLAVFQESAL
jgi:hypothetical protein